MGVAFTQEIDAISEKTPRVFGPIAQSWMICRGPNHRREFLTPEFCWDRNIFEGARFDLDEENKLNRWLALAVNTIFER